MADYLKKIGEKYAKERYTPFVCIVKWAPEEEPTFLARFSQI